MSKHPQRNTPKYSRAERRAEAKIDRFLKTVNPAPTATILEELRKLA